MSSNYELVMFPSNIAQEFFGDYPGFEPFGGGPATPILVDTVRGRLTQSLSNETPFPKSTQL